MAGIQDTRFAICIISCADHAGVRICDWCVWRGEGTLRVQALSDPDAPSWSRAVWAHLFLRDESLRRAGDGLMCLECKCVNLTV